MPTIFDTTIAEFLEPIHSHKNKSLKIIMRKQLHICNSRCQQRTKLMATTAIMDFFLKPHIEERTTCTTPKQKFGSTTDQGTKMTALSLTMHSYY